MSTTTGRDSSDAGAPDASLPVGSRAILALRTSDGREWRCGALLTKLSPLDGGPDQRIESLGNAGIRCTSIAVVE